MHIDEPVAISRLGNNELCSQFMATICIQTCNVYSVYSIEFELSALHDALH